MKGVRFMSLFETIYVIETAILIVIAFLTYKNAKKITGPISRKEVAGYFFVVVSAGPPPLKRQHLRTCLKTGFR
jgi:hypothetical protein